MAETSGLALLNSEMARQHGDALASFHASLAEASKIAASIRGGSRLLLLGMGASHWANRTVAQIYRSLGVDASAEVISEHMRAPLEGPGRVTIITSQSGESGEVLAYFRKCEDRRDHFGLTMNGNSTLARAVPSLIGKGEPESAFAATRSVLITLALHGAILDRLGYDSAGSLEVLEAGTASTAHDQATEILAACPGLFLSSRGVEHGVLEGAALTFMELARVPALALELGQLIHGPIECLNRETGLLLVRPAGPDAASVTGFARAAVDIGLAPILFDIGEHPPVEVAVSIPLPVRTGLASALQLLPAVQHLVIDAAARRVPDVGAPLRSKKVTDGEAL